MRKESTSSQNSPTFTCVVCGRDNDLVAVGSCDHRRVCYYCAMKSRLHYDYKKCPICLKILDDVFICEFSDKTPYKTLISKKEEFYEDDEFDKCQIYYTTMESKEEAIKLRGFICPIKSCRTDAFEDINGLSEHLNKVHKRFYCPYCLKENKLFLAQMNIYNKNNLEEHIKYGEYENDNALLSPPHPTCPFDNITFFNDEKMFTHMNTFHFICQLCKDKKNIIFYPELKNLLAHYKDNHYCCPFDECLADVYVVFAKEAELVSHLITKHKVENANERLNKLIFDRKNSDGKELQHEIGEFNFTEYVNKMKVDSEKHKKNNKNRYIYMNEKYVNDEGIEIEFNNKYDNYNYNNNYNKYNNYGNYNNYNHNYNYNNQGYNKWNKYGKNNNRGRGGKNNRGNKRDYYYNNKYNDNYNNNFNYNYQQNYYNKGNNDNNIEEIEQEVNNININSDNNNNYKNNNYNKGKHNNYHKENNKYKKDIDYSSLFSFYLEIIKKFIKEKIITEKISDKLVTLPKETIYQIIIMIDKFDSHDKLLELTYLNNFGINLGVHKKLKAIISSNNKENEQEFINILESLELKQLLIIYKYLYICSKKVDNLFYKLDFEQIDEDLYEDFCKREQKGDKNLTKAEIEQRKRQAYLRAELNIGGFKLTEEDKKVTEVDYSKLNKKKDQVKKEDKKKEEPPVNKPKSNLGKLLDNELNENENKESNNKGNKGKKKKGKKKFVDFDINNFDLDKDFPKFK